MIFLCRSEERHHSRREERDTWQTFHTQNPRGLSLAAGFGSLEVLEEARLPPGASMARHPPHNAEVISYVREGSLAHEDSLGTNGMVHAGEFHHRTVGTRTRHSETNASESEWTHVFRFWLRGETEFEPSQEQVRFSVAQRRGGLCLTASSDGRQGSLRIHQDAQLYSAVLEPGQHVVHELAPGRSAWLHLVQGKVTSGDVALSSGDGAGITDERAVSLTAREQTEILLLNLRQRSPPPTNGASRA
jgi:hypothetical protein